MDSWNPLKEEYPLLEFSAMILEQDVDGNKYWDIVDWNEQIMKKWQIL